MNEAKVKAAIALDQANDGSALTYRIRMLPEEAAAFCEKQDPHAGDLIKEIDAAIPRCQYTPDNPNHNTTHHNYYMGLESSRVIYVEVIRAYMESYQAVSTLNDHIQKLAKKYDADEIDDHGKHGSIFLRIWWD